jgi:multiple sugar transport system substrate-binding protein
VSDRRRPGGRIVLAALLAIGLASCGGGGSSEIVWWTPSWGEARARELAGRFEAAHPGRRVRVEVTVADGLPTRIQTALRSGAPPSVIEAQHGWVVPYAQAGLLRPIENLAGRGDFMPAALDYVTWDGALWGVPYRVETQAVLFNRGMFREAGLDPDAPPRTWPELIRAAAALTRTRPNGQPQYGFAITGGGEVGNTLFRSLPFIWMNGGDVLSRDLTTAVLHEPAAVAGLTVYTDMFTRLGASPPSTLQNDGLAIRRLFIAEAVAMYQSGPFDIGPIRDENPTLDLGVMPIPHPEGRDPAAVLGGWSFIVPRDAPDPDAARALVDFLTTPESMGFFTDTFPARVSALDLPRFADPILENFRAMLPYGRPLPQHRNWLQIVQVYVEHVQRALLEKVTPGQAMEEAARDIQALLE